MSGEKSFGANTDEVEGVDLFGGALHAEFCGDGGSCLSGDHECGEDGGELAAEAEGDERAEEAAGAESGEDVVALEAEDHAGEDGDDEDDGDATDTGLVECAQYSWPEASAAGAVAEGVDEEQGASAHGGGAAEGDASGGCERHGARAMPLSGGAK